MAWIRKRGETREGRGRYLVGWRDPDGHKRYRTIVGREEAYAFKRGLEDGLAGGTYVDPKAGGVRLEAYAAQWLRSAAHLRPRTREKYAGDLRRYIVPALGNRAVNRIRAQDLRAFVATLVDRGLAPNTVRHAYALLVSILRTARDDGLIADVPMPKRARGARGVLPSATSAEQRYLTPAQVEELANAIGPRYAGMIYLAAYAGMRWGEVAGLKVERLRLLERRVDVVETLEGEPKWGSSGTVAIPSWLARILANAIATYPAGETGLVFTAPRGGPLRYHNFLRRIWKPAVVRAGLEPLHFHELRHTCAALAIAAGAHPKAVQELLRHSSITTTLDRYGHLFPSLHGELVERLGADVPATAHRLPTAGRGDVLELEPRSEPDGA